MNTLPFPLFFIRFLIPCCQPIRWWVWHGFFYSLYILPHFTHDSYQLIIFKIEYKIVHFHLFSIYITNLVELPSTFTFWFTHQSKTLFVSRLDTTLTCDYSLFCLCSMSTKLKWQFIVIVQGFLHPCHSKEILSPLEK